jgi:hypothetical protein
MTTECTVGALEFQEAGARAVVAQFTGGALTSDGGAVLLREVERVTGILQQFTACFRDHRDPARVTHAVASLVRQRVYALALGYEDLNDHEALRHDPLFAVLAAADDLTAPLAGKSTLNRLELTAATVSEAERYNKKIAVDRGAVDRMLVDVFLQAHATPPGEIVLDLDATDDPVHGHQEGRFFHGYYGHYCYLPLYIVTSLSATTLDARALYEDLYCARGDMEHRIKEQQLGLFADRTSAATMRANQLRHSCSAVAYLLMHALRRLALAGTELARAQCTRSARAVHADAAHAAEDRRAGPGHGTEGLAGTGERLSRRRALRSGPRGAPHAPGALLTRLTPGAPIGHAPSLSLHDAARDARDRSVRRGAFRSPPQPRKNTPRTRTTSSRPRPNTHAPPHHRPTLPHIHTAHHRREKFRLGSVVSVSTVPFAIRTHARSTHEPHR